MYIQFSSKILLLAVASLTTALPLTPANTISFVSTVTSSASQHYETIFTTPQDVELISSNHGDDDNSLSQEVDLNDGPPCSEDPSQLQTSTSTEESSALHPRDPALKARWEIKCAFGHKKPSKTKLKKITTVEIESVPETAFTVEIESQVENDATPPTETHPTNAPEPVNEAKKEGSSIGEKILAGLRKVGYWFKNLVLPDVTHEGEWREQLRVGNITKTQFDILVERQRGIDQYGPPKWVDGESSHSVTWVNWAIDNKKVPLRPIERGGIRGLGHVNPGYIAWDIIDAAKNDRPAKYHKDGTPTLDWPKWAAGNAEDIGFLRPWLADGTINPVYVEYQSRRNDFVEEPIYANTRQNDPNPLFIAWQKQVADKENRPSKWLLDGSPNPEYPVWNAAARNAEPWNWKWKDDWGGEVTGEYSHDYVSWAIENMRYHEAPPRLIMGKD